MARTLEGVAEAEGLRLKALEREILGGSLPQWPAFPEARDSLRELVARGWRWAILSNTDPDLLAASIVSLGIEPDLVVTAHDAGSYKPAPGHWDVFRDRTKVSPDRHVHVAASLFHDVAPAARLGISAVWINRLSEKSDLPRAAELTNLAELPDTLDRLVHSD